jgi:Cd2+/Zn2+-exporting ATPase
MSAPESQDKKVPHFSSLKFTPAAQPAESCCTDHACSSETAAENDALSHAL